MNQNKQKQNFKNKSGLLITTVFYISLGLVVIVLFWHCSSLKQENKHLMFHINPLIKGQNLIKENIMKDYEQINTYKQKIMNIFRQKQKTQKSNINLKDKQKILKQNKSAQNNKMQKSISQISYTNKENKQKIQSNSNTKFQNINFIKRKENNNLVKSNQLNIKYVGSSKNGKHFMDPFQTKLNNNPYQNQNAMQNFLVNTNNIADKTSKQNNFKIQNNIKHFSQFKKENSQKNNEINKPKSYHIAGITGQQKQLAKKLSKLQQITSQQQYQQLIEKERRHYEEKYHISQFEEQPFCIVVPSFNNSAGDLYLHNLNSILQQNYSNYHIVFIDDSSTDDTPFKVRRFAAEHQISEEKLKIIVNKERLMAMPNLYIAAKQFCQPYQIFMVIDGDDYLIGKQILKLYNAIFQQSGNWLVYSNFIVSTGSLGYSRAYPSYVIEKGQFRRAGFSISHLRAFYTKLFTLVKQEDLKDDKGKWFRAANDVAMYMPILEMAQNKFLYVPQLCYLYNSNTGLNNHISKKQQQRSNEKIIKKKVPYSALTNLFTNKQQEQLKKSMNKRIEIKNVNMPLPLSSQKIEKYRWQ